MKKLTKKNYKKKNKKKQFSDGFINDCWTLKVQYVILIVSGVLVMNSFSEKAVSCSVMSVLSFLRRILILSRILSFGETWRIISFIFYKEADLNDFCWFTSLKSNSHTVFNHLSPYPFLDIIFYIFVQRGCGLLLIVRS